MSDQQSIFDNPLTRARELKAKGRYQPAHDILTNALKESPDDLSLKASLADLFFRWGKYRKAMILAGQLLAQNSGDYRALVVIGNTLLAKKKPDESLEYFKLAINIAPTDYIWGRIAKCHLEKNRPRAALDALNKAEQLAPPTPQLLLLRAKCHEKMGESEAHRQILLRAARLAPAEPEKFFIGVWPILSELPPRQGASVSKDFRDQCDQSTNPHLLLFETECLLKCKDFDSAAERTNLLRSLKLEDRIKKRLKALEESIKRQLRQNTRE